MREDGDADMTYKWDIFISYPRRDPIGPWVQEHFSPMLARWLGAAMPNAPQIFLDRNMETGTHWPSNLQHSLLHSRYMVAVWAPPYFGSPWCLAEWKSMLQREKLLGLGVEDKPGLVFPIRFFDGDSFPDEAKQVQGKPEDHDYTGLNSFPSGKAAQRSKAYKTFEEKVKALAEVLAKRVASVPAWKAGWPCAEAPAPAEAPTLSFGQVALR